MEASTLCQRKEILWEDLPKDLLGINTKAQEALMIIILSSATVVGMREMLLSFTATGTQFTCARHMPILERRVKQGLYKIVK